MSSATAAPLDSTLGITLVGSLVLTLLLGIATVQTSIFVQTNKQIPYMNKFTVLVLWFFLVVQAAMTSHTVYFYLVRHPGVSILDIELIWSYTVNCAFDLLLTNLTEILYSLRLWQLLRNKRYRVGLFAPVVPLILVGLALNIYIPLKIKQVKHFPDLLTVSFHWAVVLAFTSSSLVDFLLCLALIYALAKAGTRLDWADTNAAVIAAYALNSGAVATAFSFLSLIVYLLIPTNFLFFALRMVLSGIYVNSFMAMLNARFYFQRPEGLVNVTLPHGSVIVYNNGGYANHGAPAAGTSNHVTINEAGLPIFKPKTETGQLTEIQLMEVKVTKEQTETREE
ncbi:hypothetical protein E4T56_gene11381 [Termitomyces sp. T112]|nr:hypothetical protein E4T56_gene11381 [Termitomyces sp. T112]